MFLFVAVSLLSGFGGTAMSLVAGVWTRELTGSNSLAALVGLGVYLPTTLGPVLGAVVDKLPRRRLLIWTNLLTAGLLLTLLAVTAARWWIIPAVMLAFGVSHVVLDAGESALLPTVLPPEALGDVNGFRTSATEGTKLIAPLVGAGLFAWGGGPPVAVLVAAVLAVAAGLYRLVRTEPARTEPARTGSRRTRPVPAGRDLANPRTDGPATSWWAQVRDGVRYLWAEPVLRITVGIGAVAIAMSGVTTAALYAVVTDGLGRPAAFLGVITSAQGAGSIVGGLVSGRLLARLGPVRLGAGGASLVAIAFAALCVPWTPVALGAGLVIGLGLPWTLVAATTAVQLRTPADLLGRVAGTARTVLFTPLVGAIPAGAALVLLDRRLPLLLSAAGCVAAALLPALRRRAPTGVAGPGSAGGFRPVGGRRPLDRQAAEISASPARQQGDDDQQHADLRDAGHQDGVPAGQAGGEREIVDQGHQPQAEHRHREHGEGEWPARRLDGVAPDVGGEVTGRGHDEGRAPERGPVQQRRPVPGRLAEQQHREHQQRTDR
nr:MFS transporter [Micromonospora sp. DSM 115978]